MARAWPLLAIAAALALAYATGLHRLLSWPALVAHEQALRAMAAARPMATAAAYVALYICVVTSGIPGAVWMTLAGGLLFGTARGAALAVLGAGTGGVLIFLAARHLLAGLVRRHAPPALMHRVREGIDRDGFSYLLAIRLVPLVPFWLTDLAAAASGLRLAPYAAATFIGIVPATTIFASIGAGLDGMLARGQRPDLGLVLTPPVLLPLLGLAALSLLPVAWRARGLLQRIRPAAPRG